MNDAFVGQLRGYSEKGQNKNMTGTTTKKNRRE